MLISSINYMFSCFKSYEEHEVIGLVEITDKDHQYIGLFVDEKYYTCIHLFKSTTLTNDAGKTENPLCPPIPVPVFLQG